VGEVFLQKPESGEIVKEGRTVYLFVSGGEKVISVPLLKGKSILDAKFALERLGLKLGRVERIPSSQPEDMIFDQQYAEGTLLKQGEIVGVTVSAGRGGGEIMVPDLIGKSLSEAKKILTDSSLVIGKVNYQPSSTLLPNTILDQYPSSGNTLNPGDVVDLFVTKPADRNIPNEENE
jgi:beta-lactam-binding protein with PASTA domain